MAQNLQDVLRELYDSELNFCISCMWDAGFDVKLGDEMNGFVAEKNFRTENFEDIAPWMVEHAIKAWPASDFAKSR